LTYVCSIISIVGCIITIGAHLANPKHRASQQKRILLNVCLSLIGRDVFFTIVLMGSELRKFGDSCQLSDSKYDAVNKSGDYGRCKNDWPSQNYIDDYRNQKLDTEAYNEFNNCAPGVWLAAIAHYFMVAVFTWMAAEGVHCYFNVVAVLSRPRHKYLTKLSILG